MGANRDAPRGFRPVRGVGGAAAMKTHRYPWTSAAARVGKHGLVSMASGRATAYAAKSTAILGVAAHFVSSTGSGREVYVYDDPNQVFEGQMDDNTATTERIAVGACYGVSGANGVNTTNSMSKEEIDGDVTGAWNLTNCLQVVDGGLQVLNSFADTWTAFQVKISRKSHVWAKDAPRDLSHNP